MATQFEQADAIIWFARAVGAARLGDATAARESLLELSRIARRLADSSDPYWAEQVGIQEAAAGAWIALAEGDEPRAIALMTSAADREDLTEKHVAMENRLSPMRELLGELLLEADEPDRRAARVRALARVRAWPISFDRGRRYRGRRRGQGADCREVLSRAPDAR